MVIEFIEDMDDTTLFALYGVSLSKEMQTSEETFTVEGKNFSGIELASEITQRSSTGARFLREYRNGLAAWVANVS
jgi:hypothetical protein